MSRDDTHKPSSWLSSLTDIPIPTPGIPLSTSKYQTKETFKTAHVNPGVIDPGGLIGGCPLLVGIQTTVGGNTPPRKGTGFLTKIRQHDPVPSSTTSLVEAELIAGAFQRLWSTGALNAWAADPRALAGAEGFRGWDTSAAVGRCVDADMAGKERSCFFFIFCEQGGRMCPIPVRPLSFLRPCGLAGFGAEPPNRRTARVGFPQVRLCRRPSWLESGAAFCGGRGLGFNKSRCASGHTGPNEAIKHCGFVSLFNHCLGFILLAHCPF